MSTLGYRENIIRHLESLAKLPDFVGPDELIFGWFDDLYLPGQEGEGLNPGVHEQGVAEFEALFSDDELVAMAKFHVIFEEAFPALSRDSRTYQSDLGWQTVANRAKAAFASFGA